jgi:hypothetical protein
MESEPPTSGDRVVECGIHAFKERATYEAASIRSFGGQGLCQTQQREGRLGGVRPASAPPPEIWCGIAFSGP